MAIMVQGGVGFALPVLSSHPAAAAPGTITLYRLNDGKIYSIDDTGTTNEVGIADHGALEGLEDNDHPQYARKNDTSTVFTPASDGTLVLVVQNSAGTLNLLAVNTTDGKVSINGDLEVSGRIIANGGISNS